MFVEQYYVQTPMGAYKIDAYCTKYNIAVECDEVYNPHHKPEYDIPRQEQITSILQCAWVRCKCDHDAMDVYDTIRQVHEAIVARTRKSHLSGASELDTVEEDLKLPNYSPYMDLLQAFVLDGTNYEIHMVWQDGHPFFRASDVGHVLGIQNLHSILATPLYADCNDTMITVETPAGPQQLLYLSEPTVYSIVCRSNKEIARPFQHWVGNLLVTLREKGKYEMQTQLNHSECETQRLLETFRQQASMTQAAIRKAKHDAIVQSFSGEERPLAYIGVIRQERDKLLVNIGSTNCIQERAASLVDEFGGISIIAAFEVELHREFQSFLQNHDQVKPFVHTGEVFLMSEKDLTVLLNIAENNEHKYRFLSSELMHKLECLETKLATLEKQVQVQDVPQASNILEPEHRKYTQARGSKVQRYSETCVLLETYPGCAEATRDPKLDKPVANMIKTAAAGKTLYKGFRWAMLDRHLPDDTVQDIGDTVEAKTVKRGLVAMLDLDRSKVIKVFCDHKAAAEDRKFKGLAAISAAVKKKTQSGGHMWSMWYDVDEALKQAYLADHELPNPRVATNGKQIHKIHPITGDIVKSYSSAAHVMQELRVARLSLYDAISNGCILKGYKWTYAEA